MSVVVEDPDFTLYHGDALEVLAGLPATSVDCIATSPPFFGLRDYGVGGQIGLEDTLQEWVVKLVAVFGEARRVLSPTGCLFIEIGDSYNSGTSSSRLGSTLEGSHGYWENPHIKHRINAGGLKPKDLLLQPFELAFALRADGWFMRQVIVWAKPNCMPESATDRCTTAHSYVLLLSKNLHYWFDTDAISEPAEWARWGDQTVPKYNGTDTATGWMKPKGKNELIAEHLPPGASALRRQEGFNERWKQKEFVRSRETREAEEGVRGFCSGTPNFTRLEGRKNPRSVWTIPTQGFPGAHFATWPEALAERIIRAGCPPDGVVLDPFMGSGTTALVARRLGRRSIGIELNETYCALAARRLQQLSLLA